MSGIDASIPLSGKNPSLMSSLGDVMNVANAATQLKRQGVAYSQEKGSLDARNAVAKVVSDPQYHDPATGMFDLNKGAPAIVAADPQNYVAADTISKLAAANNDLITVKKASLGLADASRAMLGSTVGALATKPDLSKADIQGSLDQLRDQAPDAAPIIDVWEKGLKTLPDDPKVLQQVVNRARLQVMPPSSQITAQTPGGATFNTGQVSGVINTNPAAGATGPVPGTITQNAVPPTSVDTQATDPVTGNPIIVHRDPQTGAISLRPAPVGAAPGGAPGGGGAPGAGGGPMFNFPPGESSQTKLDLENQRQAALAAIQQAPQMHQTNQGVLEEIDKVAATGTVGPKLQPILSTLGVHFDTPEQKASAYDLVGKYLERNAIQAAQSMGPQTNMGLEAQIKANGSLGYNPTAIKKITKLNDALVSGAEAYQPGLEKAVTSSPNQIFAKRNYDAAWAQNFDPRIMMIYNAKKANDTQELHDLTANLTPAQKQDLARKAQNLKLLSTQGHL